MAIDFGGHFFGNTFDPKDPPEYIKCFGSYKVGREYMLTTKQIVSAFLKK